MRWVRTFFFLLTHSIFPEVHTCVNLRERNTDSQDKSCVLVQKTGFPQLYIQGVFLCVQVQTELQPVFKLLHARGNSPNKILGTISAQNSCLTRSFHQLIQRGGSHAFNNKVARLSGFKSRPDGLSIRHCSWCSFIFYERFVTSLHSSIDNGNGSHGWSDFLLHWSKSSTNHCHTASCLACPLPLLFGTEKKDVSRKKHPNNPQYWHGDCMWKILDSGSVCQEWTWVTDQEKLQFLKNWFMVMRNNKANNQKHDNQLSCTIHSVNYFLKLLLCKNVTWFTVCFCGAFSQLWLGLFTVLQRQDPGLSWGPEKQVKLIDCNHCMFTKSPERSDGRLVQIQSGLMLNFQETEHVRNKVQRKREKHFEKAAHPQWRSCLGVCHCCHQTPQDMQTPFFFWRHTLSGKTILCQKIPLIGAVSGFILIHES